MNDIFSKIIIANDNLNILVNTCSIKYNNLLSFSNCMYFQLYYSPSNYIQIQIKKAIMQEKFLTAYLSKNCENLMSDFTHE